MHQHGALDEHTVHEGTKHGLRVELRVPEDQELGDALSNHHAGGSQDSRGHERVLSGRVSVA